MTPQNKASFAELFFLDVLVARLANVFISDDVYYAVPERYVSEARLDLVQRLASFIRFSIEWNERCESTNPPNASEFDAFGDLIGPGKWRVIWANASVPILDAPVFYANEVSWRRDE
jgi:hypothetical protein